MNHIINNENALSTPFAGVKVAYIAPSIELIALDNEISLVLESTPPLGPGESANNSAPEFFKNDPWKNSLT